MLALGPVLASLLLAAFAAPVSQTSFDPATLPEQSGRVLQYSLSPRGDVDGVILGNGLEVFLPPHLGPLVVQTVRPGDAVIVHGLRARAVPMMQAASLTNAASGRTVLTDAAAAVGSELPRERPRPMSVTGVVRMPLHGPRGDLNGALLEDGMIIRMPPPVAARSVDRLRAGSAVSAQGMGVAGPFGRVLETDRIDPR